MLLFPSYVAQTVSTVLAFWTTLTFQHFYSLGLNGRIVSLQVCVLLSWLLSWAAPIWMLKHLGKSQYIRCINGTNNADVTFVNTFGCCGGSIVSFLKKRVCSRSNTICWAFCFTSIYISVLLHILHICRFICVRVQSWFPLQKRSSDAPDHMTVGLSQEVTLLCAHLL